MSGDIDNRLEQKESRQGLIISGRVLRWGALPPAAGPARTQWCVGRGLTSLMDGRRNYGIGLRKVIAHLPNGAIDLPPSYPLHEHHSKDIALDIGRGRVRSWFSLRRRLGDLDERMHGRGLILFDTEWEAAEKACRTALQSAADSFNWLDDARYDLGPGQLIDVSSFTGRSTQPRTVDDLVDSAHITVHAAGELVGGLFGCRMVHSDGRWFDECIVGLLHLRFGNSAGLWARYVCSICVQDPGDCEHEPGLAYPVTATRTPEGECTICEDTQCLAHKPGNTYEVIAYPRLTDPQLREVSLTPRPRDPLTRISGRSVDDEDLREQLGRLPESDEIVLHHGCMYPCSGYSEMPDD